MQKPLLNSHECFHKTAAYWKWTPPLTISWKLSQNISWKPLFEDRSKQISFSVTVLKYCIIVKDNSILESTQNQLCFNVKFRGWFNVDKLTLFQRWNTVIFLVLLERFLIFQTSWYINKLAFLESAQNQRCFNVKFRRWFNVDKLMLFRRWNTVTFSTLI